MVVVRRGSTKRGLRCCNWFLKFGAASALVPLLFLLRLRVSNDANGIQREDQKAQSSDWVMPFLLSVDYSTIESEVVELEHCSSPSNWTDFTATAIPLLHQYTSVFVKELTDQLEDLKSAESAKRKLEEELLLQLLEQYSAEHFLCDFDMYQPTVENHTQTGQKLRDFVLSQDRASSSTDLILIVSAFTDIDQLEALLSSVGDFIVVIHLEKSDESFRVAVEQLVQSNEYIFLVQFGCVVYKTDSLSHINLRILRWLTLDLNISYQHAMLLDASAFPLTHDLHGAINKEAVLHRESRSVWLGELTHKGGHVNSSQVHLLQNKRLIYGKLHKRLPKVDHSIDISSISPKIQKHMHFKSTSGNQGIYSRKVVLKLLRSKDVMELFALSKYGCCCCIEERNWIAALHMIGYGSEALSHPSMFQLWGGDSQTCQGSMRNAVLTTNSSLCYRNEDPNVAALYFKGDKMMEYLLDAKQRGYIFARKFRSNSHDSVILQQEIRRTVW